MSEETFLWVLWLPCVGGLPLLLPPLSPPPVAAAIVAALLTLISLTERNIVHSIPLTLNILQFTHTNITHTHIPHSFQTYHPTLKPFTRYIQLISRISLTRNLTQCNSHSPQSTFIQFSRPLTPCLARSLTHLDPQFGKTSYVGLSGPFIASPVGSNPSVLPVLGVILST